MKHVYTMLGGISILVLFTGCVAQHNCSSQEMIGMKEKGFKVEEIDRLCVTYKIQDEAVQVMKRAVESELEKTRQEGNQAMPVTATNSIQARSVRGVSGPAATCATRIGTCRLPQSVNGGLPCGCSTPYGLIPGVTR
ncbi:MAG: hypothetical protein JSR62_04980 [Nitrospira sp.]|nr:hypothetical protein [Nitrospira sp.]